MVFVEMNGYAREDFYDEVQQTLHRRGYTVDEGEDGVLYEGDGVVVEEADGGVEIKGPSDSEEELIESLLTP
jgi:hypothetical protein